MAPSGWGTRSQRLLLTCLPSCSRVILSRALFALGDAVAPFVLMHVLIKPGPVSVDASDGDREVLIRVGCLLDRLIGATQETSDGGNAHQPVLAVSGQFSG